MHPWMPRWGFVTPIQPTQCMIFTLLSWCSISVNYHFNEFVGLYWIRATWTVNDVQPFINNMTSFGGRGVNGLLNKIKKVASMDINEQLTSSLESIGSSSSFAFPVSSWSSLPRIFDIWSIISPQIMWVSLQIIWSSSLLQTMRGHAEMDVCAQLNDKCTLLTQSEDIVVWTGSFQSYGTGTEIDTEPVCTGVLTISWCLTTAVQAWNGTYIMFWVTCNT